MTSSDSISEFWTKFLAHRDRLEQITSADDPVYDAILAELQLIHPELYFEFCLSPGANELIITADGNTEFFGLMDEIVNAAPEIDNWQISALKPKTGFPITTNWESVSVRIADVRFQPIRDPDSGSLDLVLFVPDLQSGTESAAHNALLRAIDHGLGERRFAETIRGTVVRALNADQHFELTYPLIEIDEYISQQHLDV